MRIPSPPKLIVPVLFVERAMQEFSRAVEQVPEWSTTVEHGYIAAEIYWNRPETWQTLRALAGRGVVWMPQEA
jgi:hypothetical protein